MLNAAAQALAEYTDPLSISHGSVYPKVSALRRASKHVAAAVLRQAIEEGSAGHEVTGDLNEVVTKAMWEPRYLPLKRG